MARALLILVWLCTIGIACYFYGDTTTERRPAPTPDASGRFPLPGPSRFDPTLVVSDQIPWVDVCSGTAFAIDQRGHWLTAHHVVRGCRQLAIVTGPGRGVRVDEIYSHPGADVTLISGPKAPALSVGSSLFRRQDGLHFGYPRGVPGEVHGALLGRIKVPGSRALKHPVGRGRARTCRRPPARRLERRPGRGAGRHVVGLAIAASPRRGRVTSAAPESLHDVLARAGVDPAETEPATPPDVVLAGSNYAAVGARLRERMSVAKLLCWKRDRVSRRPQLH